MAMALLTFVGFLRFDELANLKLKDLALHDTRFELLLKVVKLINFARALLSLLSSLARIVFPWGNLEKYLS